MITNALNPILTTPDQDSATAAKKTQAGVNYVNSLLKTVDKGYGKLTVEKVKRHLKIIKNLNGKVDALVNTYTANTNNSIKVSNNLLKSSKTLIKAQAQIAAMVEDFNSNTSAVVESVKNIPNIINPKIDEVKSSLLEIPKNISASIKNVRNALLNKYAEISAGITIIKEAVVSKIKNLWGLIKGAIVGTFTKLKNGIGNTLQSIKNRIVSGFNRVKDGFSNFGKSITKLGSAIKSNTKGAFTDLFKFLKSGGFWLGAAQMLLTFFLSPPGIILLAYITEKVRQWWEKSSIRVFFGKVADFWEKYISPALKAFGEWWVDKAWPWITEKLGQLKQWWDETAYPFIRDTLVPFFVKLGDLAAYGVTKAKEWMEEKFWPWIFGLWDNLGKIATGIKEGIQSGWDWIRSLPDRVMGFLWKAANALPDWAKILFGIDPVEAKARAESTLDVAKLKQQIETALQAKVASAKDFLIQTDPNAPAAFAEAIQNDPQFKDILKTNRYLIKDIRAMADAQVKERKQEIIAKPPAAGPVVLKDPITRSMEDRDRRERELRELMQSNTDPLLQGQKTTEEIMLKILEKVDKPSTTSTTTNNQSAIIISGGGNDRMYNPNMAIA